MRSFAKPCGILAAALTIGFASVCGHPHGLLVPDVSAQEALSHPANISAQDLSGPQVRIGALVCPLENAVAAYILFEQTRPLCDFRSTDGQISRFPIKIWAQVAGAPTERGTVAVWQVTAAPGFVDDDLKGDYEVLAEGSILSNGRVTLVPADNDFVRVSTLALPEMAEGMTTPRNVAAWIASLRF